MAQFSKGTGQGLDLMTNNTLQEDVNSHCPCFNQMVAIFDNKKNVIGHNVFDSMTKINKELDIDKHSINSYELDTESQVVSETDHSSDKDVSNEQPSNIVISAEDSPLEMSNQSTTAHKVQTNWKESTIKIMSSKFHQIKQLGNQTLIPSKVLLKKTISNIWYA
ncbi:hypothetical protein O181_011493 [Austropuccinia psidii MF-1]|uniref:Uncharacterized protein n=1 Tax=Austropuccinia psidii MF-1 TaxID=1389203 RepID=A0A9Q3BVE2_9BASI|nr:hypothetical protein [Austropuccinia psidii MF-1]